jgi:glucose-6-phosphate 1-dehydrogenase
VPTETGTPVAPPCTLVIFGAGGDLTKRLLAPALYNLAGSGLLNDGLKILGLDHNAHTDEQWRADLTATMQSFTRDKAAEFHADRIDEAQWQFVTDRMSYLVADFQDAASYRALGARFEGRSSTISARPACSNRRKAFSAAS